MIFSTLLLDTHDSTWMQQQCNYWTDMTLHGCSNRHDISSTTGQTRLYMVQPQTEFQCNYWIDMTLHGCNRQGIGATTGQKEIYMTAATGRISVQILDRHNSTWLKQTGYQCYYWTDMILHGCSKRQDISASTGQT